jgi:hypothetical protein
MSRQNARIANAGVVLAAAFLMMPLEALAGDRVHAPSRPTTSSPPAPTPIVRALPQVGVLTVGVEGVLQPATEALFVDIRGPDGQLRRFPVEGGNAAIQYRQVTLRRGEMLTIRWTPGK